MQLRFILRPFAVACVLAVSLSACNTGTKDGDTNVELGSNKKEGPANSQDGVMGGDSTTAGLTRDTASQTTARDVYKAASSAKDRNHDGIAD